MRPGLKWPNRRIALSIALCAMALSCASFFDPQRVLSTMAPRDTLPLFWHVEGSGGAGLYVLASIQLGPQGGWKYPAAIEQAFQNSSALVVETNPNELSQDVLAALLKQYGRLGPGQSLQRILSTTTWRMLDSRLRNSSLSRGSVDRMRPWLLAELLTLESIRQHGYVAEGGVDAAFVKQADERSIVTLENIQLQLASMASLPMATQELALVDILKQEEGSDDHLQELVNAWRSGDEHELKHLIFQNNLKDEAFAPFFEAMVFQRSTRMLAQLEVLLNATQHAGETVFVTIGVENLIGKRGICARLEKKGYTVKRFGRKALREMGNQEGIIAAHP